MHFGSLPISWPGGSRTAVLLNIMYEQWAPGTAPGLGPMGNPLRPGLVDHQALSWSDYGWRTGVGRLLDTLAGASASATFYASGILTETAPATLVDIAAAGHEICGHAWSQDLLLPSMDAEEERLQLKACIEALTSVTGQRPRGWMSPRCTPGPHTATLLAEQRLTWTGDVFDADLPYVLDTPAGPLVAFPFGLEVNDVPTNVRYGAPARELLSRFNEVADALTEEDRISYIDITFHAHVGARPAGLAALRGILGEAETRGLWVGNRSAALVHLHGHAEEGTEQRA